MLKHFIYINQILKGGNIDIYKNHIKYYALTWISKENHFRKVNQQSMCEGQEGLTRYVVFQYTFYCHIADIHIYSYC